ncbi:MAG: DNA polymerase III subunit delta [Firmicutes bacterium]|nr:DNA polymerase III subunit delta [Bacillota bacterium]
MKNVYLICGEERYLVAQKENELKNAVLKDPAMAAMNHSVFKDNIDIGTLTADCTMLPFMSEKRLVQVRYSGLFTAGKKDDTDAIVKFIADIPETTVLIFTESETDGRNSLYKAVKKYGEVFDFKPLKPYELADYVKKRCKAKIPADYFVTCVGDSLERINGELDKLMVYTGGRDITEADIDEVCSKTPDMNIFKLLEAVGRRNTAEALAIYHNMLSAKGSPFGVLTMLVRQLKIMIECRYLAEKGMPAKQIADNLPEYKLFERSARGYVEQSKNFKRTALYKYLTQCYKCEENIKNGLVDGEMGVELLIIGMNDRI